MGRELAKNRQERYRDTDQGPERMTMEDGFQAMGLDERTYRARMVAVLMQIETRLADLDLTMRRMAGQGVRNEDELRRSYMHIRDDADRVLHDLDNCSPPSFTRRAHNEDECSAPNPGAQPEGTDHGNV